MMACFFYDEMYMRCVVLLCGQLRTFDNDALIKLNKQNFYNEMESVDMFIASWKNKGISLNHGPIPSDMYAGQLDADAVKKHYEEKYNVRVHDVELNDWEDWWASLSPDKKLIAQTPDRPELGMQTSVPIQFLYQQAYGAASQHPCFFSADMISVMRPDVCFTHTLARHALEGDCVYHNQPRGLTDIGFASGRMNDWHFYCTPGASHFLSDIFDTIETNSLVEIESSKPIFKYNNVRLLAAKASLNGLKINETPTFSAIVARRDDNIHKLREQVEFYRGIARSRV